MNESEWNVYFEQIKNIGKLYNSLDDALKEFKFLNDRMTDDFCISLALIHNCKTGQFKVVFKEEENWQVLVCNARFIFSDLPCTVQKIDQKDRI